MATILYQYRYKNPTAQATAHLEPWVEWVQAAAEHAGQSDFLSDELIQYMAHLLLDGMKQPHLFEKSPSLQWLHAQASVGKQRIQAMRATGDACLMLTGFFPQYAKEKLIPPYYIIRIGQSSYAVVSALKASANEPEYARFFNQLSDQFVRLVEILQAVRQVNNPPPVEFACTNRLQ